MYYILNTVLQELISCRVTLCPCSIISDISVLKLKMDKCSRQDNLFMKKVLICLSYTHLFSSIHHLLFVIIRVSPSVGSLGLILCQCFTVLSLLQHAQHLYRHIYLCCKEESSTQAHFEKLYTLLALISMELANEEVVVDLIRVALALQVHMHCVYSPE